MPNPYVNKVIYGNQTLIDLTGDTVTAADVASGVSFHDASGAAQTGSYVPVTPASVTPSNVSPAALTANTPVTPTANGYAIESYASVTPSSAGAYFQSGICNMTTSGYAYDSQQGETETTLWENPRPTSTFTSQIVTLSDNYTNYSKIIFYYKYKNTDSTVYSVNYDKAVIDSWYDTWSDGDGVGIICYYSSGTYYARRFSRQEVDNKFLIFSCSDIGSSSNYNAYCIPTKITGIS